MKVITSSRLELHQVTPAKLHQLFQEENDIFLMDYFGTDALGFEHYKSLHKNGMESHQNSLMMFRILLRGTNTVIGDCGFHSWNNFHRNAELYYRLNAEEYRNLGYMSEILPIVLLYGFNEMSLHRIEAKVAEDNAPSLKLLLKNSFKMEGRHREDYLVGDHYEDSLIYALLSSDSKA